MWRVLGVAGLLLVAVAPTAPLLWTASASTEPVTSSVGLAFGGALLNSLVVAFFVAATSLAVGLPAGVSIALYDFPGRRLFAALLALPILVPTFLWAIGWSSLTSEISGVSGCVLVFSAAAIPLVLLMSYAATGSLSGSQFDAARVAGGEGTVLLHACRHAAMPALVAAGLGGVLTLSDPGPGQILGLRTAASEVLISFSALYDYGLAGRQCAVLTAVVLVFAVPLAWVAAPRIAAEIMARQAAPLRRVRMRRGATAVVGIFTALVLVGTVAPCSGLVLPLQRSEGLQRVWDVIIRTGGNSVLYAVGAGFVATALGVLLGLLAGRSSGLRVLCIGAAIAMFSVPPAFSALGLVEIASHVPAWADPILRGRAVVCMALGLRFFPVAALLALRAWGSTSRSWVLAAGVHGVSLGTYLRKVAGPIVLPSAAVAVLLVALLASADVGTVLLLHPPGEASFPLAIFTVMANAPESLVASLCSAYVAGTAGLMVVAWFAAGRRSA